MYKIQISKLGKESYIIHNGIFKVLPDVIADENTNLTLALINSNKSIELYSGLDVELEPLWLEVCEYHENKKGNKNGSK